MAPSLACSNLLCFRRLTDRGLRQRGVLVLPVLAANQAKSVHFCSKLWHTWLLWNNQKFRIGLPLIVTVVSLISLSHPLRRRYSSISSDAWSTKTARTSHYWDIRIRQWSKYAAGDRQQRSKTAKNWLEITTSLDSLVDSQGISGYRSINQQLLSKQQQHDNYQLVEQLYSQQSYILQNTLGWSAFQSYLSSRQSRYSIFRITSVRTCSTTLL